MMHSNNFVFCLKADGRILREMNGKVYMPFGSEYSLYLKNLDMRRACVTVSIDGADPFDGLAMLVDGKGMLNLERFVRNGNLNAGNRFKFIERNTVVEAGRGVQAEDGLVSVTIEFERPPIVHSLVPLPEVHHYYYLPQNGPQRLRGVSAGTPNPAHWGSTISASVGGNLAQGYNCSVGGAAPLMGDGVTSANVYANQAGITAAGSASNQTFTMTSGFVGDGNPFTMTLQILGEGHKKVTRPVTVRDRPRCSTCGTVGNVGQKFCAACGTSLQLIA